MRLDLWKDYLDAVLQFPTLTPISLLRHWEDLLSRPVPFMPKSDQRVRDALLGMTDADAIAVLRALSRWASELQDPSAPRTTADLCVRVAALDSRGESADMQALDRLLAALVRQSRAAGPARGAQGLAHRREARGGCMIHHTDEIPGLASTALSNAGLQIAYRCSRSHTAGRVLVERLGSDAVLRVAIAHLVGLVVDEQAELTDGLAVDLGDYDGANDEEQLASAALCLWVLETWADGSSPILDRFVNETSTDASRIAYRACVAWARDPSNVIIEARCHRIFGHAEEWRAWAPLAARAWSASRSPSLTAVLGETS